MGETIGMCFRAPFIELPVHRKVACIAKLGRVGALVPQELEDMEEREDWEDRVETSETIDSGDDADDVERANEERRINVGKLSSALLAFEQSDGRWSYIDRAVHILWDMAAHI